MTSNRIPMLAADIRRAHGAAQDAEKASAKCAIEAGQALIEAKSLVKHGEWLPFLKEAGMPARTAQRYMTLADSGLKCDTVSYLGGIRGALWFLSKWRMPSFSEALLITSADRQKAFDDGADYFPGDVAYVWESAEHHGYYHLGALNGDAGTVSKRPMLPTVECPGDRPVNTTIIDWLTLHFAVPVDDWHLDFMPRHVPEIALPPEWRGVEVVEREVAE